MLGVGAHRIMPIVEEAQAWSLRLELGAEFDQALSTLLERAELKDNGIAISICLPTGASGGFPAQSENLVFQHFVPIKVQRRGVEMRLVIENEEPRSKIDQVLLKTVARAHRWFDDLVSGKASSIAALAQREKVSVRFVGRGIRLAFLSPEIVKVIAEGRQPLGLTAERLLKHTRLPSDWSEQGNILKVG